MDTSGLYNSIHTGPEIDDAIARALPGGYYDKWVSQLPGQNLLDNWYFGNPVDQRQGRVVVPNTTYYSDNTLATAAGTTSAYVTAYRYATGTANGVNYASFKLTDSDTAPTYYAAPENVVRGYAKGGYTIDRWKAGLNSSLVLVENGFVSFADTLNKQAGCIIDQIPENMASFVGKKLTCSILVESISGNWGVQTGGAGAVVTSAGLSTVTVDSFIEHPFAIRLFNISPLASIRIIAAKLELGSQQTLAHQDENGVWQLNEIPDYGEQLARCQRHQIIFGDFISNVALGIGQAVSDTQAIIHIPLPVTMNKMPTPVLTGVISIRCANVYYQSSSVSLDAAGPVEIMLRCVLSGLTPGAVCEAFIVPANQLILDANL